jgi:hypothetical protein
MAISSRAKGNRVRICGLRSTVWMAALAATIACSAAVPPAKSDETAPSPPPVPVDASVFKGDPGNQFEARFGAFAHGVGSVERDTYDINGSFLTPRMKVGVTGYWAYFLPRFRVGGAVNLQGRTSFGYGDMLLTLPITNWLFLEPFVGGAAHNGSLVPTQTLAGLGCPLLFHVGASVGVPLNEHWTVVGTFEHLSNGKGVFGVDCGTNEIQGGNQGLNDYGLSLGYAF